MRLTKKEAEIMEIIWNSDKALSSSDILEDHPELNRNTVLVILKKLLSSGFLQIQTTEIKSKVLTRFYSPKISKYEYEKSKIGADRLFGFVTKFVEDDVNDDDELEELEKIIQEKKKRLMKK